MKKSVILIVVLVFGFVFWQFYIGQFYYGEANLMGKPAPHFEVVGLDGKKLSTQDVIGKKVVLVNFWATWCDTCRYEIPALNSLHKMLDPDRFLLISLLEDSVNSLEELNPLFEKFNAKLPVDFPVYWDQDQIVADLYGTYRIPESFLIDLKGNVVYFHQGAIVEKDKERLVKQIRELFQNKN